MMFFSMTLDKNKFGSFVVIFAITLAIACFFSIDRDSGGNGMSNLGMLGVSDPVDNPVLETPAVDVDIGYLIFSYTMPPTPGSVDTYLQKTLQNLTPPPEAAKIDRSGD